MIVVAALVTVALIPLGLSAWATTSYRSAVHSLHDELAPIALADATVESRAVATCWNDGGPASVTTLRLSSEHRYHDVATSVDAHLSALGFTSGPPPTSSLSTSRRWTRERSDALDADIVELVRHPGGTSLRLVGRPYDTDLVLCTLF